MSSIQLRELVERHDALRSAIEDVKTKLDSLSTDNTGLQTTLDAIDGNTDGLEADTTAIRSSVSSADSKLTEKDLLWKRLEVTFPDSGPHNLTVVGGQDGQKIKVYHVLMIAKQSASASNFAIVELSAESETLATQNRFEIQVEPGERDSHVSRLVDSPWVLPDGDDVRLRTNSNFLMGYAVTHIGYLQE